MRKTVTFIGYLILSLTLFLLLMLALNLVTANTTAISFQFPQNANEIKFSFVKLFLSALKVAIIMLSGFAAGWLASAVFCFIISLFNSNKMIRFLEKAFFLLWAVPVTLIAVAAIYLKNQIFPGSFLYESALTAVFAFFILAKLMLENIRREKQKKYYVTNKLYNKNTLFLSIKFYNPFYLLPVFENIKWLIPSLLGIAIISTEVISLTGTKFHSLSRLIIHSENIFFVFYLLLLILIYVLLHLCLSVIPSKISK